MATGTAAADYEFDGAAFGLKTLIGHSSATYGWTPAARGESGKTGSSSGSFSFPFIRAKGENGVFLLPDDRWRIIVQESRGDREITCRDLNVTNLVIQRELSGPCSISCDVNPNDTSAQGLYLKPWEQYIHIEKVMLGKRRIWCTGIVQPSDIDPSSGILHLQAKGFAFYPKGIPILEDVTKLANDAFFMVVEIWRHLQQDFPNGNLGVTVFPTTSGVIMLPGYAFDGSLLNLNFFATFVRATDKLDCGDFIDALARDIPFDYMELSEWNADRTDVSKSIELGYPRLGLIQENIAFVLNENVLTAQPHTETEIDWISDVGVTGWFPGVEYSFTLANADPLRLRRYLDEDDAYIDSNERSQAWAHRRLARRQTPEYWQQITINPNHPNAPMGSFDIGDTITVSGFMPWVGNISQLHKIIAISVDVAKNTTTLTLYADGAFNYDPIFFPDGITNIIANPGFDFNLEGWSATGPGWTLDLSQGASRLGSVMIAADGTSHDLLTQAFGLSDFQIFPMSIKAKCTGAVSSGDAVQLVAQFYDDNSNPTQAVEVAAITAPTGTVPWQTLAGTLITPPGSSSVAMRLHVDASMSAGQVWFDDAVLTI
jgi:hypothetical protein